MRVVLDTDIIVSSLLSPSGAPARVLDAWREMRYVLLLSPAQLEQVRAVLERPRIRRRYGVTAADVEAVCQALERCALGVAGEGSLGESVLSDPDDEEFLLCALEGLADGIVSGDHHLLGLGAFREIPILSARVPGSVGRGRAMKAPRVPAAALTGTTWEAWIAAHIALAS